MEKYISYYNFFKDKSDFAHMMYTISAAFVPDDAPGLQKDLFKVSKFGKEVVMWEDSKTRVDYTGWLGDATWPGVKIKIGAGDSWDAFWGNSNDGSMYGDLEAVLNDNTSFGKDDYMADLDADNIIHRLDTDASLVEVMNLYYEETKNGDMRAKEFLRNNSYEKVEDAIFNRAGVDSLQGLQEKWLDSYEFLKALKNGEAYIGK